MELWTYLHAGWLLDLDVPAKSSVTTAAVQSRASRSAYKHWVFHSNETHHIAKSIPVVVGHRLSTTCHQLHQTYCGSRSSRSHLSACQQGQSVLINCLTVAPEYSHVCDFSENVCPLLH